MKKLLLLVAVLLLASGASIAQYDYDEPIDQSQITEVYEVDEEIDLQNPENSTYQSHYEYEDTDGNVTSEDEFIYYDDEPVGE